MTTKLLITGATGHSGSEITQLLSLQGMNTRALVRDQDKAQKMPHIEWVTGNFDDEDSLVAAMSGIHKAFIVTPVDPRHVEWVKIFISAAKKAGVKHIVKFSGFGASMDSASEIIRMHAESDQLIKDSGLTYTLLQPNSFFQNILMSIPSIQAQSSFYLPMKEGSQSLIDVRDIAEVAVEVLTNDGHENKTYKLSGPEALNFHQVAEILSEVLGKPVQYIDVPTEAAKQSMLEMGMPEWHANSLAEILSLFGEGHHVEITSTVEDITGHAPRGFRSFVEDHRELFL